MKKILFLCLGLVSFVLGTIGVVLPVLPTVPFYLLAVFCFARSSEKLHDRFVASNLYKKHLESYVEKKGMMMKTKLSIIASVTLLMGTGIFLMARKAVWVPCFILAAVWVCHVFYFLFVVKTIPAAE